MKNLLLRVRRNVRLLGMVQKIPHHLLLQKLKTAFSIRKTLTVSKIKETLNTQEQQRIDEEQGFLAGNSEFWKMQPSRSWGDVQTRLFTLVNTGQEEFLEDFMRQWLQFGRSSTLLPLIARSDLSQKALVKVIREFDYGADSPMAKRFYESLQFTANFFGTALYLLDSEEVAPIEKRVAATYPSRPQAYHAALDSSILVPSARPNSLTGTIHASVTRKPARHRLIIVDALKDPQRLSLLFANAEKVTVLSPGDLYGRLSFANLQLHSRPQEIIVAHPRSRISRFSSKYHELHDETRKVATEMVDELERQGNGFLGEAAPYMALHLADKLFFQALPVAAFEDFVTADDYDQIVIASAGYIPQEKFFEGLASGVDLAQDPRIEFTSLTPSLKLRMSFAKNASQALLPTKMKDTSSAVVDSIIRPLPETLTEMAEKAWHGTASLRTFPLSQNLRRDSMKTTSRVLFVTTQIGAYNFSSAQYIDILSRNYNLLIGFVGRNAASLFNSSSSEILPPPPAKMQALSGADLEKGTQLNDFLSAFVGQTRTKLLREGRCSLTAHVMYNNADEIAVGGLSAGYSHWILLKHWFKRLEMNNHLPELVVLSPLRPAMVGMAAAAARQHGIPSVSLEPHGLNAAYCRYSLVGTDRYGVITNFYKDEAARGFGIPADRVNVIGSPRMKAPEQYDVMERQIAVRQALKKNNDILFAEEETVITFFTQPSRWEQISEVWTMVLTALRDLPNVRLLLQLHPEEGDARLERYMTIAEKFGMTDRINTVKASAIEAIEAADLVLACYSATVVEAAMYRKPVLCVINGAGDYPVNQHEVVGAPLLRDADSLRNEISDFIVDPKPFQQKALAFLEREPQVIEGQESRLIEMLDAMLATPAADNLRSDKEMPQSLFITGPYQVFDI